MKLHTYSNGIKQQDINNINPNEDPDKEENKQAICPTHESFLPEDLVDRRHFLKLVVIGATSLCLPSIAVFSGIPSNKSLGPEIIRISPQNEANPVRFSDGSIVIYYMKRNNHVESIQSRDNGLTWSDPEVEFPVFGETAYACRSLIDHTGEVHIWFVQRGEENSQLPGNRHLDIWHSHTINGRSSWTEPNLIWKGYCGAIRGVLQMENGRIVVPFGAWKTGNENLPNNTGSNYTTVIFSDDGGKNWQQSSTALISPVYDGYNGNNYGACEPCITKLPNGQLWLLIRTQTGFLYESFSQDGINWIPAKHSRFTTSNSPAGFVDLEDNRIVVFWNNHMLPPRVDGQGVYGGRDGLHAAITDDSGQTWHGFREVYLDPTRDESPPRSGDRGTAYPNGEVTDDGHIILVTGQGTNARAIIRFHPNWLYETHRQHDFTSDGLEGWSVYKGIGPAKNWWRDRIPGAQLVTHPDKANAHVLHVRHPDKEDADGATWNFPSGQKGTLTLRLRINTGFDGAQISLVDRLFNPTDDQGEQLSNFKLFVKTDGRINEKMNLTPELWHILTLEWDVKKEICTVKIDGNEAVRLSMTNLTMNGISYLRLRSTAPTVDKTGFYVEKIKVEVEQS